MGLAAVGCSVASSEVASEEAAQTEATAITIDSSGGGTVHSTMLVSGAQKTPKAMPSPSSWSCGSRVDTIRTYDAENFAYVEIKNPGAQPAAVAVSLDGAPDWNLALFAYASATAPATQDEAGGCMTASSGDYLGGGTTIGPELSTKRGSGLVVPAGGSAFVTLVTGAKTGAFGVTVTTEMLGVGGPIAVGTEVDDSASMPVLVSGVAKTPKALPSPGSWDCGNRIQSIRSYGPEAYAYFEVKNEGDRDAAVALSLDGQPDHSLAFFAFASQTAPASIDDVKGFMVSAAGDLVSSGQTRSPELSAKRGGSLVVPAHASTWVMLATGRKTGAFTVMARTEALGAADKASIEIPAAKGASATKSVLVSHASKTPAMLPSPNSWSCGADVASIRSYGPEAFAYVEVKNTSDAAAAVAPRSRASPTTTSRCSRTPRRRPRPPSKT